MRQADSSSCSLLGMTNPLGFCELFRPALHWLRMHFIYGINAVTEALKARGRAFEWVGVAKDRHDLRLQRVVEESRRNVLRCVSFPEPNLIAWLGTMRIREWSRSLRPS